MSGIAGIFYLDGRPVKTETIEGMLAKIAHRGPDGRGIWCCGSVGLGHCMLWSTPESIHEHQPILANHADGVLVADARLDNRDDLIKSLSRISPLPMGVSDGQLILEAYREWGDECVGKLEGDFSFVVWDSKRHLFFCARDRVGVKPFYYIRTPFLFAFASEIKALLSLPEIPIEVNERKIAEYLAQYFEDTVETFYRDIYRLPPGHLMKISDVVHYKSQYWEIDFQEETKPKNESDYISAFKELFFEVMRCRLRSAHSIGSMLSGGLDSSSISCTAHNLMHSRKDKPFPVFSVIYQDQTDIERASFDELSYIRHVIDSGYFEPNFVRGDHLSPLIDPDQLFKELDEPYFAPTYYFYRAIYQLAQQRGVRVMLDGTDGDRTVYHGLEYLSDLARSGRWLKLYKEADALSKGQYPLQTSKKILQNYGLKPVVPEVIFTLKRWLTNNRRTMNYSQHLIRPEFLKRLGLRYSDLAHYGKNYKTLPQIHYRELTSGVIPLTLELLDKSCAMHHIDARYPFFDRRLMEFCLSLPPSLLLSKGWTRYILRIAMQDILPTPVQWRADKANLQTAFCTQLFQKEHSRLKPETVTLSSKLTDCIKIDLFLHALNTCISDPAQHPLEANLIFGVIILSNWLIRAGYV